MTSFKEFLKKQKEHIEIQGQKPFPDKIELGIKFREQSRFISELGEWAMAEIKKIIGYAPIYPVTLDFYKEIASACLGRDEVMRRLKELNK